MKSVWLVLCDCDFHSVCPLMNKDMRLMEGIAQAPLRSPLTPPQSHHNLHRTGETDSWRAQTKPCMRQDPGGRSSVPTRDWPRLAGDLLLRVPWTARRPNQSILKEISLEYSLEGLIIEAETTTLWATWYKELTHWKDPEAGKDWRWEEKGTTEDEMVG